MSLTSDLDIIEPLSSFLKQQNIIPKSMFGRWDALWPNYCWVILFFLGIVVLIS